MKIVFLFILVWSYILSAENHFPAGWPWRGVGIPAYVIDTDKKVIEHIMQSNMNAVRVFFQIKKTMEKKTISSHEALFKNLKNAEHIATELNEKNIKTVINLGDFPITKDLCADKKNPQYWENEQCINQIYNFVETTVKFFLNKDIGIQAFQFFGEPVVIVDGKSKVPKQWINIYKNIIKIVRKYDKNSFLIFSRGVWASPSEYSSFVPFKDNKIIYNFHMYDPHAYTHQGIKQYKNDYGYPGLIRLRYWDKSKILDTMMSIIEFQSKYQVPISVCEFGVVRWAEGREQYLLDLIDVFNTNKWSWFYFSLGSTWKGWDPRYEVKNDKSRTLEKIGYKTSTWIMLERYFKEGKQ